jgi:2'-5' RNA ligase
MMKEKKHFYFIAVIPPDDVCKTITNIKQDFAYRFQSKHALKVVPHITLKSPFRLSESSYPDLLKWFEELTITVHPFQQELKDFGCFAANRSPVVYINPAANKFLYQLHDEVMQQFRKKFIQFEPVKAENNYKPHMTVAYRDLAPEEFKKAWNEYKDRSFSSIFEVNRFWLLQHVQNKWEQVAQYLL